MEGADPQNASGSQKKPRVDRRRKYPALKDQKTCVLELPPIIEEQVLNPIPLQTVPPPTRARKPSPSPAQTVSGPSRAARAQKPGPRRARAVHGPRNPVHAQTPSDQSTGSAIGQVVEGVIDGTFQDGYLISINIGGITMKGVAYGSMNNEPDLAPEGQTVQQQNVQESQRQDERHSSSQFVAPTVRKIQPWSRANSGGGSSSNSTKHQDKDQARPDVRGRGKGKEKV